MLKSFIKVKRILEDKSGSGKATSLMTLSEMINKEASRFILVHEALKSLSKELKVKTSWKLVSAMLYKKILMLTNGSNLNFPQIMIDFQHLVVLKLFTNF